MKRKFTSLKITLVMLTCCFCSNAGNNDWKGETLAAPLSFIENKGQILGSSNEAAENVLFKASCKNLDLYITTFGLAYVFKNTVSDPQISMPDFKVPPATVINFCRADMVLAGAKISKTNLVKELPSPGFYNYYNTGNPKGILNVKAYSKITLLNVYEGIDWVIYFTGENSVKYDFVVKPGANPAHIKMLYHYTEAPHIIPAGGMEVKTPLGVIYESAPVSYQNSNEVRTQFKMLGDTVGFQLSNYNVNQEIRIDPALAWSAYYGGSGDEYGLCTCYDAGNIWVGGQTISSNFPTLNPGGGTFFLGTIGGNWDGILLRFNSSTRALVWATYYGGNGFERVAGVYSDGTNFWFTGTTFSTNMPIVALPGAYNQAFLAGSFDGFIGRLGMNGILNWATLYGGVGDDRLSGISGSGANVFISGWCQSGIPIVNLPGAYNQAVYGGGSYDACILRLNGSTCALNWSSYYGGNDDDEGYAISNDGTNTIMTGFARSTNLPLQAGTGSYNQGVNGGGADVFILQVNSSTCARLWATYYGGSNDDIGYGGYSDGSSFWVTGGTYSWNFPVQTLAGAYNQGSLAGYEDAFILKFNTSGTRLWASFYGGSTGWSQIGWTVHSNGTDIFFAGQTDASNFPVLANACGYNQPNYGGSTDAFLVQLNAVTCACQWSTYFGGSGFENVRGFYNAAGFLFAIGSTGSLNYPTAVYPGAYNNNTSGGGLDIFLAGFDICNILPITIRSVSSECNGENNTVNWECETSGAGKFIVESSNDLFSWENLDEIVPKNQTLKFSFTDARPKNERTYYRIREFLLSGEINTSAIIEQDPCSSGEGINIFPNPSSDFIFISQKISTDGPLQIKIFNAMGKLVKLSEENTSLQFNISDLDPGIYIVEIKSSSCDSKHKFIKSM